MQPIVRSIRESAPSQKGGAVFSGRGAHRINGSSIGLVLRFKLMFAYSHVPGYNQIKKDLFQITV